MARIVDAERPTGGEGAVRSLPGSCGSVADARELYHRVLSSVGGLRVSARQGDSCLLPRRNETLQCRVKEHR
jgi:hypothetical protein